MKIFDAHNHLQDERFGRRQTGESLRAVKPRDAAEAFVETVHAGLVAASGVVAKSGVISFRWITGQWVRY
ncbi:MAG: hypothetical protein HY300_09820 [Verrucomicrobia bacterium]|nr:hypothetical protein [Verrucomicrobiota bacterium]